MDIEITSVKENEKQNTDIEQNGIELRLGDIIEIQSPTNLDYHENTYYIEYIDETKIKLINVSNLKKQTLTLSEDGKLDDDFNIVNEDTRYKMVVNFLLQSILVIGHLQSSSLELFHGDYNFNNVFVKRLDKEQEQSFEFNVFTVL
jgi:hypothetical protein